ncbi:MAG TPA: serine protease [Variovorax sp.]|nr:serine protease [Variovorax sp.]
MNDPARISSAGEARTARAHRSLRLLEPLDAGRLAGTLSQCGDLAARLRLGDTSMHAEVRSLLETGKAALDRTRERPDLVSQLTPLEVTGLEAIVVAVGRPALLIRNDHFDAPVSPWEMLEPHRPEIEALIASVGRIELTGHPSLDWVGTGFMVAPGVAATARHVVQEFASSDWQGRWVPDPGIRVRIDFNEQLEPTAPREFGISGIVAVHDRLDVALLRVEPAAQGDPPPPLALDVGGAPLQPGRAAYVVGYPALDSRRNDSATMQRIFGDVYNVKRLQPGYLVDWSAAQFAYLHDCSTLGGNSGSCVVDLESGQVIGIHYGGRFGEINFASSTRDWARAPVLKDLGAVLR